MNFSLRERKQGLTVSARNYEGAINSQIHTNIGYKQKHTHRDAQKENMIGNRISIQETQKYDTF